jgi:hypothetical protein
MATTLTFNPYENLSSYVDLVGRQGFNDPLYSLIFDAQLSGLTPEMQTVNDKPTSGKVNGVEFSGTANRIDWQDMVVLSPYATLGANVVSGDATITVTDGATFMAKVGNSDYLPLVRLTNPVTGLEEDLLVTAGFGTNTLTVTRAQNSTTAAAYSTGQKVMYVPQASELLGINSIDNSVAPVGNYNHTMPLYESVAMSVFTENREAPGNFTGMDAQGNLAIARLLSRVSTMAYKGVRRPTGTSTANIREAGGLKFFSTKRTTAATFNENFLKDRLIELADNSVTSEVYVALSDSLYNTVNAMKTVRVTGGGMDVSGSDVKLTYDTFTVGNIRAHLYRSGYLDAGEACFFDPRRFSLMYTNGGQPRMRDEAQGGFLKKSGIYGEVTFVARNGASAGLWYTQLS